MKKIRLVVVVLCIIFVSVTAFFGFFKKENGMWKNSIPDYKYGMDIKGARELVYTLSDEENEKYVYVDEAGNVKGEVWKEGSSIKPEDETAEGTENEETQQTEAVPFAKETRMIKENPDDQLTKENFEQAKEIIQKRLKEQGITENNIRIDNVTGKLMIENASKEEQIERIEQLVSKPGKFEIVDYQNGVVLMDNSDIKKVSVVYSNDSAYNTYLQIQFNAEGTNKLKEISNKYVEIKDETQNAEETPEEAEEKEETEKKYVTISFDGMKMMTTYFGEEMSNGILQISVGQARTEPSEFRKDYNSAKIIADMLNSGVLPVVYKLETDNFVKSEITTQMQRNMKIIVGIAIAIVSILSIVKFGKKGLLASISNIGYIAILSLVLRYTNVEITVNSILAGVIMVIANMLFLKMLLNTKETHTYQEVSKKFYLALIPVIALAVVFTLTKNSGIASIGMMVFWAIILNVVYNLIITNTLLKDGEDW